MAPIYFRRSINWRIQDEEKAPGTRAPPLGPNSFIFMQFLAEKLQNNRLVHYSRDLVPCQENPGSATGIFNKGKVFKA